MDFSDCCHLSAVRQIQEPENDKKNLMRSKLLPKSQLVSSIPKPKPYVRRSREPRSKSCSSSSCLNQSVRPSLIPVSTAVRVKSSLSLIPPKSDFQPVIRSKQIQTNIQKPYCRPRSAALTKAAHVKNPYSHVKAKVDSKPPVSLQLKSHNLPPQESLEKSNEPVDDITDAETFVELSPGDQIPEEKSLSDEGPTLKKKSRKNNRRRPNKLLQPSEELTFSEVEGCLLEQKKNFCLMGGYTYDDSFITTECKVEFPLSFEKQMEEISKSWLQLIGDIITSKIKIGKGGSSPSFLPDPSLDLHNDLLRFFKNLHAQDEPLHEKLRKIKEEQLTVMAVVEHNVEILSNELKDLKDSYSELERSHTQLEEELAIISLENKDLSEKYTLAVDKYDNEKLKTMELEKNEVVIAKSILEIKQLMQFTEGNCREIENRGKKAETNQQNLEEIFKNIEINYEKECKKYRNLLEKYNKSEELIKKLKYEVEENRFIRKTLEEKNKELKEELASLKASLDEKQNKWKYELEESRFHKLNLEEKNKELQEELNNFKATLEENQKKRNELEEEVSNKMEKLNELEIELNSIKSTKMDRDKQQDNASEILINDLVSDVQQRNQQIQELKKKINRMEHMLRDKSVREEKLTMQISKLHKKCNDSGTFLRNQVKELQYTISELHSEVAELQKVLGQKTLESEQQDLLIKQYTKLLRMRNVSVPTNLNRNQSGKKAEKLMALTSDHYKNDIEVDMELSLRQQKMAQMFNLLEHKQMEIMKMERRIRGLQKFQDENERIEREEVHNRFKGFLSTYTCSVRSSGGSS